MSKKLLYGLLYILVIGTLSVFAVCHVRQSAIHHYRTSTSIFIAEPARPARITIDEDGFLLSDADGFLLSDALVVLFIVGILAGILIFIYGAIWLVVTLRSQRRPQGKHNRRRHDNIYKTRIHADFGSD